MAGILVSLSLILSTIKVNNVLKGGIKKEEILDNLSDMLEFSSAQPDYDENAWDMKDYIDEFPDDIDIARKIVQIITNDNLYEEILVMNSKGEYVDIKKYVFDKIKICLNCGDIREDIEKDSLQELCEKKIKEDIEDPDSELYLHDDDQAFTINKKNLDLCCFLCRVQIYKSFEQCVEIPTTTTTTTSIADSKFDSPPRKRRKY